MLLLISPAKTLDFTTPSPTTEFSQPDFLKQSRQLIKELRSLSSADISELMKVSEKIAALNFQRFVDWRTPFTEKNAKQALFAFQGDVYTGMAAEQFSLADSQFAQQHLRIAAPPVRDPVDLRAGAAFGRGQCLGLGYRRTRRMGAVRFRAPKSKRRSQ